MRTMDDDRTRPGWKSGRRAFTRRRVDAAPTVERGRPAGRAARRVAGWWRGSARRERPPDSGPRDVRSRLRDGSITFVFQPIIDLRDGSTVGFEGLTRIDAEVGTVIDLFDAAAAQGALLDLELHAISSILSQAASLPDEAYVSVNASPSTLESSAFRRAVGDFPLAQLVVEVNEREVVDDYGRLRSAVRPLRAGGVRLAVDDAGAGVASLHHLIELRPDIIKLDGALTHAIQRDRGQRAMARALAAFAAETGAVVVAECVESLASAQSLADLGVDHGQGFALGRPAELDLTGR